MITQGKYSDGVLLASLPVRLEFTDDRRLLVQNPSLSLVFSEEEIEFSDRLGDVARFIYLPDGATIETNDNATIDTFLIRSPQARGGRLIHRLEKRSGIAAIATVLFILVVSGTLYYGLPWLSFHVAQKVPLSIDRQIGRGTLIALERSLQPTKTDARDRLRVQEQLRRLLPDRKPDALPRIEFYSMGGGAPNAFALPGNIIIISDELITLTTRDDEIAAVLAHELGHLEKRHGLQSILRSSAALLVVTAVTGDLSTLTNFAGMLPLMLLNNGYSRAFEEEADRHAHDLMLARGVELKYFSSVMQKLDAGRPKTGKAASYFSTHPATEDRLKLFPPAPEEPKTEPDKLAEVVEESTSAAADLLQEDEEDWQTVDAFEQSPINNPTYKPALAHLPLKADAGTLQRIGLERADYRFPTADQAPQVLFQSIPAYPMTMKAAGTEGQVMVDFIVDPEGNVRAAYAAHSTHRSFEGPAVEAVQKWKYRPALKDEHPIAARVVVPVIFSLNEADKQPPAVIQAPVLKYSAEEIKTAGYDNVDDFIAGRPEITDYLKKQKTKPAPVVPEIEKDEPETGEESSTFRPPVIRDEAALKIEQERSTYVLSHYDLAPRVRTEPRPAYPPAMRLAGISGEVLIVVIVDLDGNAQVPFVVHSTQKEFEEAALDAVRKMKFVPARKNREAVSSSMEITVVFDIATTDFQAPQPSVSSAPKDN